jgi:hypothetical protein
MRAPKASSSVQVLSGLFRRLFLTGLADVQTAGRLAFFALAVLVHLFGAIIAWP